MFPAQESLKLSLRLLEVDLYRRFGVSENLIDRSKTFLDTEIDVPIVDGEIPISNERIEAVLRIEVYTLY
ncbi:MAG: hypothetical protein AAFQ82_06545 [Myxococcota bacterium]